MVTTLALQTYAEKVELGSSGSPSEDLQATARD